MATTPFARKLRALSRVASLLCLTAELACGAHDVAPTAPPIPVTPLAPVPEYLGTLLAPARVATLSTAQQTAWNAYVRRSRQRMGADQALVAAELTRIGGTTVIRPPNTAADFTVLTSWTAAWAASTAGSALIKTVLSYQTASGGWGKHIDYALGPRAPGMGYNSESDEWAYVGTIDNGATVTELRLLAVAAPADTAARSAFERGTSYLMDSQFPSGCSPQVWPLMGSYHDAATNNDNAAVNVIRFLRDIDRGTFPFVASATRTRATAALAQAMQCLLNTQVVVQNTRTTWAQQHDPLTNEPVVGRSYELPSLAGQEGAKILDLLMEDTAPSAAIVTAVHAAIAFYRATAIPNVRYVAGVGLVPTAGAGPLWARMAEIGTNRPIFSNRDGIRLYDFDLLTDRRTGYAWYGGEPATSLRTFETWVRTHPAP